MSEELEPITDTQDLLHCYNPTVCKELKEQNLLLKKAVLECIKTEKGVVPDIVYDLGIFPPKP